MITFVTGRPNQMKYVLMELFYGLLFGAIFVLFNMLLKIHFIHLTFYLVILTASLVRLIVNLVTERLTKITFDSERKLILFDSKSILFKTERRALSFDNCSVETDARSLKQEQLNNYQTFYFLQGKTEFFKLDKSKDGFTEDSMKDIYQTIESLAFPIIKL